MKSSSLPASVFYQSVMESFSQKPRESKLSYLKEFIFWQKQSSHVMIGPCYLSILHKLFRRVLRCSSRKIEQIMKLQIEYISKCTYSIIILIVTKLQSSMRSSSLPGPQFRCVLICLVWDRSFPPKPQETKLFNLLKELLMRG